MATKKFTNNASTTLASVLAAGGTTISVTDGSAFPVLSSGEEMMVTLRNSAGLYEIVRVTGHTSGSINSFTGVTRGQEGTTDRSWSAGDLIELSITAEALNNFETHDHDGVYAKLVDVQNGAHVYGTTSGTANAITVTMSPAVTSYTLGQLFLFVPIADNTGATTIDFGAGALNLVNRDGGSLAGAALQAGIPALVAYNGSGFTLVSNEVSLSSTQTLSNKTLDSPTIDTGVSGTAISTNPILLEDSDTLLASQKAIKSYVDDRPVNSVSSSSSRVIDVLNPGDFSEIIGVLTFDAGTTPDSIYIRIWEGVTVLSSGYQSLATRISSSASVSAVAYTDRISFFNTSVSAKCVLSYSIRSLPVGSNFMVIVDGTFLVDNSEVIRSFGHITVGTMSGYRVELSTENMLNVEHWWRKV